jgi:hypothetical protein
MNLIQEDRIFKKYFEPIAEKQIRENNDITEVVIHGTGGGLSAKGIINWMLGGERASQYVKGVALFHYEIDLNGDVYQILDDKYWVWHSTSGKHDKNTIGIELVNTSSENKGGYQIEQYEALIKVLKLLLPKYPITKIGGHGAVQKKFSGGYKLCPGHLFDWGMLENIFNMQKLEDEYFLIKGGKIV